MHSNDIHTHGLQKKRQIFILIYIYIYMYIWIVIFVYVCHTVLLIVFMDRGKLKTLPVPLYLGACCN